MSKIYDILEKYHARDWNVEFLWEWTFFDKLRHSADTTNKRVSDSWPFVVFTPRCDFVCDVKPFPCCSTRYDSPFTVDGCVIYGGTRVILLPSYSSAALFPTWIYSSDNVIFWPQHSVMAERKRKPIFSFRFNGSFYYFFHMSFMMLFFKEILLREPS